MFISAPPTAAAPARPGGFALFDPSVTTNWGDYTFVLAESPGYDAAELRDVVASIVAEINAGTGSRHRLANDIAPSWVPATGEIIVRISTDCPQVAPVDFRTMGCGGPFERSDTRWVSGRVTVTPDGLDATTLRGTLAHEIGHALGLGHPAPGSGSYELMDDELVTGESRFHDGDLAGMASLRP